jgi:translation elongation factor EF-G
MDKMGADFKHTLKDVEEKLGAKTAIVTYPIGAENTFKGVVMLLEEQSVIWLGDETGAKYEVGPIPQDMVEEIAAERAHLIEQICETDDVLLEKYLNGEVPTLVELKKALRAATIAYKLVPCTVAPHSRNKGVQPLLDSVILPSPLDVPRPKAKSPSNERNRRPQPDVKSHSPDYPSKSKLTPTSASSRMSASTPAKSPVAPISITPLGTKPSASVVSSLCTPTTAKKCPRPSLEKSSEWWV